MAIPGRDPANPGEYRFGLKKRYSYEVRLRKVERPVFEKAKEALLSALGRKAPPQPAAPGKAPAPGEEKKPALEISPVFAFRVGGLVALLLLLLLTAFFFAQSVYLPGERVTAEVSAASLSAVVEDSDILTASDPENFRYPYHTAYSKTHILSSGLPNITVGAAVYDSVVPNSVFVLRSSRYQAETYPDFKSSLSLRLSTIGMVANEISVSELDKLGPGALLLLPSGYIPEELVAGEKPMLFSLMERGVTVFYIGQDFSRMVSKSGSIVPTPPSFLGSRERRITFDPGAALAPDSTVAIKNPLYGASGLDSSWMFGGAYSVLSYKGGFIILAPQTLDGGWETGSAAGADVARIFFQTRWLTPAADTAGVFNLSGDDSLELFTPSFEGDSAYLKVFGYNQQRGSGFYSASFLQKSAKGEIYSRGHSILPGSISPTPMDLIILLRESGGEKFLFLSVTNLSGEVDRTGIAGTRVSLNSQPSISHTFDLPTGDYILNIVDQEGNRYARSYLRVKDVEFVPGLFNTRTDTYGFRILGDGSPVVLDTVTAKVDGGAYGTYTFTDASGFDVDLRASGYGPLPDGMHEVSFQSGSFTYTLPIDKRAPTPFYAQPFFLAAFVLAAAALAAAYVFKASEIPVYGLDIPDFPPQTTTKIPVGRETLLGLLDRVNQKYRWKHTPLRLSEIKGAFKDILHEGKPVFISDYNLEYLLDQLTGLGLLRKEAGYYSKSSWEKETGKSAKYLSMFRGLRDICINEAVPFTPLGASGEYDSKITVLGQDIFVHLYEGADVVGRAIGSLHLGINMILAEDDAEVEELNELLSSGDEAATLLKLEVESGSVQIKTLDGLQKMIKDMKV
ncbi:MAG: hypothetical protein AB1657_03575 [Candidatus Micrarchaeota archaeon]